ncbi:MAG: isoprenyl transferase [Clostridia bacterium]|nr:isoprenyl transferase [Clostridia bacterium]MDD4048978.1 isoprenyl transferase [Clostridia bacterium]
MFHHIKNFFVKKPTIVTKEDILKDPLPQHIAIIMDGNGRWASSKGFPRIAGHRAGAENLRKIIELCGDLKIHYFTVYAFSTENWKRPKEEVDALMSLLVEYIETELDVLKKNGVKIKIIGNVEELPNKAQLQIRKAEKETSINSKLFLQIALNYGGRREIIDAVKGIVRDTASGQLQLDDIDDNTFSKYLYTVDVPDPDLLIRTAGEKRISNFLLWQCAYTEFWVTSVYWPEFSSKHFYMAIDEFQRRHRRFGGL